MRIAVPQRAAFGQRQAAADCEFVCVDQHRFNVMIADTQGFAMDLMRTTAKRLRNVDRMM